MTEPDRVAVVIVTYNSAVHLPALFASLPAALGDLESVDVVVADNDSSDQTQTLVESLCPSATFVQIGRNAGYAAGVNAGIEVAPPDTTAYLIVNPDIELGTEAIPRLLAALHLQKAGIAVPKLIEPDGSLQYSLRRTPTVLRALGESLFGGRIAGRIPLLGEVVRDPTAYEVANEVDWASGAAMLISESCTRATGRWEESFFLYSEEVDFTLRAREAGFRIVYEPKAIGVHIGGEAHVNPELWSLLTINRVRAFRRRRGLPRGLAFWAASMLGEALRSIGGGEPHRRAVKALVSGIEFPPGGRLHVPLSD